MAYETILVEREDGVLILTFNRPEKRNALNAKLLRESSRVLQEASVDDSVKAAILTGAGPAFCSGADLSDPMGGVDLKQPGINRNVMLEPFVSYGFLVEQIENFPKPLIAAVNGIAFGAGLGVASACDIRIASDNARFAAVFIKRAICPDMGTSYYLPRIVGANKALEMMWSGDPVDAQEARRIGLANWVVPADKLMTEAKSYARRLATGPSVAIELTKRLVRDSQRASSPTVQMANESFAQSVVAQTEDCREGLAAFLEKREPRYKGR